MPWVYEQRTGRLSIRGRYISTGYSGKGGGRNDPAQDGVPRFGPIPAGAYDISEPTDTIEHGPYVLRLTPVWPEVMRGRAGFLIHGDNRAHDASVGCIILDRDTRERIQTSGDPHLLVVP